MGFSSISASSSQVPDVALEDLSERSHDSDNGHQDSPPENSQLQAATSASSLATDWLRRDNGLDFRSHPLIGEVFLLPVNSPGGNWYTQLTSGKSSLDPDNYSRYRVVSVRIQSDDDPGDFEVIFFACIF